VPYTLLSQVRYDACSHYSKFRQFWRRPGTGSYESAVSQRILPFSRLSSLSIHNHDFPFHPEGGLYQEFAIRSPVYPFLTQAHRGRRPARVNRYSPRDIIQAIFDR
jgi:hypothetical protein